MAIFVTFSARDTETKDNLLTAGQNGLNIMRRNLDRDTETKDNLLTAGQNGLNIMRRNLDSFKSKVIHALVVLFYMRQ